jgi:hypothetical protein
MSIGALECLRPKFHHDLCHTVSEHSIHMLDQRFRPLFYGAINTVNSVCAHAWHKYSTNRRTGFQGEELGNVDRKIEYSHNTKVVKLSKEQKTRGETFSSPASVDENYEQILEIPVRISVLATEP